MSRCKILFVAFLALLALELRAAAQCSFSDNLDGGPCCGLTQATLPLFKGFTQNALDVCWRDCGLDQVSTVTGRWTNINILPGQILPCGEKRMRLDIVNGSNVLLWRGPMRLQYSRTWLATDSSGLQNQVWRFLVNGDLTVYPAAGPQPCPVPPCVSAHGNRAHFTGYVDFVENCLVPPVLVEHSWMLTHACDALDHHAGFARAGGFHPDRSYSFVAPDAGFVPGPIQPLEGTPFSPFESVRGRAFTPPPVTAVCTFEEPSVHSLFPQQQMCFCGLPGNNQFLIADLRISTACGTSIANPLVGPFLPGYVSMGLGSWTNPSAYPGVQALRWNIGGYDYLDPCIGTPQHEIFYGVTTIGGYPATQLVGGSPGGPLPPIFIDQSNSQKNNGATVMNVPFVSRHILNLNH
jgi:hypothetical protein